MTDPDFAPCPGVPLRLAPGVSLLLAPNPSPMTALGTNTFLLGEERLIVIDPGPALPAHLEALMQAIGGRPVSHILVTHSHLDHSPLAAPLAARTGAPVLAFGASDTGRSAVMGRLVTEGLSGGGEGVHHDFAPQHRLAHGEAVENGEVALTALHTPGHMGNHLCFAWGNAVFCGDLVMGWSSSLVSPPDGDVADYMRSLALLKKRSPGTLFAAHGAPINAPVQRIDALAAHRIDREAQIVAALTRPRTLGDLTATIYTDTPPALHPAAARNVLAHLIDLHERRKINAAPTLGAEAVFSLV